MQRLPIYIVPTTKPRRRPMWRRALPGVLLAAFVLVAFAISGAQRADDDTTPVAAATR